MHRRRLLRLVLPAVLAALISAGCVPQTGTTTSQSPPKPTFPLELTDDQGVTTHLDKAPKRIITWAPSNTEILFALGLGDEVVGVSGDFDNYPPEAKTIEHVGGADFQPNVEKVVSLTPDLVIDGFGGGEDWKARLREQGIAVFTVQADGFADLLHDIDTIGRLTGADAKAERLIRDMNETASAIADRVAKDARVTCFFEVGFQGGFFTVGPGSFIFDLLERAGCDPVTKDAKTQFPQWSVEALLQDDPDVYLVSSESGSTVAAVEKRQGFGSLSAVKDHRVFLIDSDLISRPGPRVVDGLDALAKALHPTATT